MNIRFGLGKFQGSSYTKLRNIGTKYSQIYCGKTDSCTMNGSSSGSDTDHIRYWLIPGHRGNTSRDGPHKREELSGHQQGLRHVQELPPEVRHPRHRRGRHDVLQRRGRRHPVRPVQAQARIGAGGQGTGRCGLQGLCHRHGKQHARLPAEHPELDGLLRRNGQPPGRELGFDVGLRPLIGASPAAPPPRRAPAMATSDQCFATSNDPGTADSFGLCLPGQ